MSNTDPTKKPGENSGAREGQQFCFSYDNHHVTHKYSQVR